MTTYYTQLDLERRYREAYGVDDYVKLLLHLDASPVADSSPAAHTVTEAGGFAINTSTKEFGLASGKWTTWNTDALVVPASSDWNLAAGDWTIDFWLNPDSLSDNGALLGVYDYSASARSWRIIKKNDNIEMEYSANGGSYSTLQWGDCLSSGWQHVCVARTGNDVNLWINGVFEATKTLSATLYNASSTELIIGNTKSTADGYYNGLRGYLDEIRVSKGAYRPGQSSDPLYVQSGTGFTPPTRAYASEVVLSWNTELAATRDHRRVRQSQVDSARDYYNLIFQTELAATRDYRQTIYTQVDSERDYRRLNNTDLPATRDYRQTIYTQVDSERDYRSTQYGELAIEHDWRLPTGYNVYVDDVYDQFLEQGTASCLLSLADGDHSVQFNGQSDFFEQAGKVFNLTISAGQVLNQLPTVSSPYTQTKPDGIYLYWTYVGQAPASFYIWTSTVGYTHVGEPDYIVTAKQPSIWHKQNLGSLAEDLYVTICAATAVSEGPYSQLLVSHLTAATAPAWQTVEDYK